MRPMFKQGAVAFQQGLEVFGLVGLAAGKQDHVMRALDRINAIDLHESDTADQGCKIGTFGGAGRGIAQRVAIQKDTPGYGI